MKQAMLGYFTSADFSIAMSKLKLYTLDIFTLLEMDPKAASDHYFVVITNHILLMI
jgi:hypothetical protein